MSLSKYKLEYKNIRKELDVELAKFRKENCFELIDDRNLIKCNLTENYRVNNGVSTLLYAVKRTHNGEMILPKDCKLLQYNSIRI